MRNAAECQVSRGRILYEPGFRFRMVQSKGPRGDGVQFSRLGSWKFTTSKSVTYWHFGCMPLAGRLHSDSISESVRLHECSKCSPEAPATDSENKKLEVKQHPVLGTIVPGITPQCPAFAEASDGHVQLSDEIARFDGGGGCIL